MTENEEKKEKDVVTRLSEYLVATRKSQADISKRIGVSSSALSQYLSGNYRADAAGLEEKIMDFLRLEAERNKVKSLEMGFADTSQARAGLTILKYCHTKRKLGLIVSDAGLGKTSILKQYCSQNKHTVFVTSFSGILPHNLMDRILAEMGTSKEGHENTKYEEVIKVLKGTDKLLIIDEAQHMKYGLIEKMRHVYDMCGVGVVLAGNNTVVQKMIGKETLYFDQLFSRVAVRAQLTGNVSLKDMECFLKASNLRDLATDRSIISFLVDKANEKGHYRQVMNILEMGLEMVAQEENGVLTVDHLAEATKLVFNVGA